MISKVSAVAVLAWLGFALACTPNQPLPLPSNPPTSVKACPETACTAGQVCNRAIAGGTCTAPCASDDSCGAIAAGLVCHPGAGGVCAPDCTATVGGVTGDAICQALDGTLGCEAGRCVTRVASGTAFVRFFLATQDADAVTISADTTLLGALVAGQASDYLPVPAGDHVFDFDLGTGTPLDQAITVAGGTHYTVPIYGTATSGFDTKWFVDDILFAPLGDAGVRYFQACRSITTQDVLFDLGSGAQPVVGGVSFYTSPDVATITAGAGTLKIGNSASTDPAMIGPATLVAGQLYTLITWCNGNVPVPASTLLSPVQTQPSEIVAELKASGYRLLNASDLSQLHLSFDHRAELATSTLGAGDYDPVTNYRLITPGTHDVRLWRDFSGAGGVPSGNEIIDPAFTTSQTFAPGSVYTIIVGGEGSADPATLQIKMLDETLDPSLFSSGTQAVARLLNFAAALPTASLQLSQVLPAETGPETPIGGPVAYLGDGGDQIFDTSLPSNFKLRSDQDSLTGGSSSGSSSGDGSLKTPAIAFTPGTRYTAIAYGSAAPVTFWLIGPTTQVAKVP